MSNTYLKRILCVAAISGFCTINMIGQESNPTLIIRADDMGSFHSANVACLESYTKGVISSVEIMPIAPWFPEAVKFLKENPGLDVGVHLAITSEWDNVKWRPLTICPSLVDANGYFYPKIFPNEYYPHQSIKENNPNLKEIENEFRAQIELTLKNLPQTSHLSGHMGSLAFTPEVEAIVEKLSKEYNLPAVDRPEAATQYQLMYKGYDGKSGTPEGKEAAFIKMLSSLEKGKKYIFLDHPAFDDSEMQTVGHIKYENVAKDRQGVYQLFTSPNVKQTLNDKNIKVVSYNDVLKGLSRAESSKKLDKAFNNYLQAISETKGQDIHSIMILKDGKVVKEKWLSEGAENKPHVLHSVSKTFTASAVGLAIAEGKLHLDDKVISFFPELLPAEISSNLKALEIRHLLTMSSGHDTDPTRSISGKEGANWVKEFLNTPLEHEPGTCFVYNSMGTYVLSAIVQKVTGEKVIDYLYPRLFRPLGIVGATWDDSPQGVNCGGWGLYLKTEDLAKLGQLFLQKGKWNNQQVLPEEWVNEASTYKIASLPAGTKKENLKMKASESDWLQGYCYQMWRCRHNAFRADGAYGQFIIVLPDKNAVIAITANVDDTQKELNLVWKYIYPAL